MTADLVATALRDAPDALGRPERLLLVAVAEYAEQFGQREFELGIAHLAERTGLTRSGVRQALGRLARHGADVRVPIGVGKDGRPYYTCRGQAPRYRLPKLAGDTPR